MDLQQIQRQGRMAIPRSRRLVIDALHYHRQVPTSAHDRMIDLRPVMAARKAAPQRISLSLVFVKAYALVAARRPELRQVYVRWPLPHLYQYRDSVAIIATHRQWRDESWLFWTRFQRPESLTLAEMQLHLDRCQTEEPNEIFRQQWQLSGLPTPLRRLCWWWNLNMSVRKRAKRMGTFLLTTIAGSGAEIQHPPGFLTSNLTYGPIDERGFSRVTIAYDHRLMDGKYIADTLCELEETLASSLVAELVGTHRCAA